MSKNNLIIEERQWTISSALPLMPKGITFTFDFQYTKCLLFIVIPQVLLWIFYLWFFQHYLPSLGSFFQVEPCNSHLIHLSNESCLTPMHICQLQMFNTNTKSSRGRSPISSQRSSTRSCQALLHKSLMGCLTLGHKPLLIV